MEKSLSKAISTALTAAAKEAVDARVKQVNTAAIDKAVRKQAHELDDVFAAAVDTAIQKQAKEAGTDFRLYRQQCHQAAGQRDRSRPQGGCASQTRQSCQKDRTQSKDPRSMYVPGCVCLPGRY